MLSLDALILSGGFKVSTVRNILKRGFDVLIALAMMPWALLVLPITVLCI